MRRWPLDPKLNTALPLALSVSLLLAVVGWAGGCKDSNGDDSGDAGTALDAADPMDANGQVDGSGPVPDGGTLADGGDPTPDAGVDPVAQVCSRWLADRQDLSEGTWSGNVSSCDPGDVTANGRANALKMVNLYRWLADLPTATTDAGRDANAQACALMMHANGSLSHSPPTNWDCYTSAGDSAAGASNIATAPGVSAVDMYMVDSGNPSTMGHRRWILSNSLGAIGLGTTSSYSCMTVISTGGNANAAWTAYPPPGVFPHGAVQPSWSSIDNTGWTLQSDSISLSGAQVSITSGGQDRPVTVSQLLSGYGSTHAISFIPNGWTTQPDTTYTVSVTGISPTITYDVQVVTCN
jgi:uncharacterized protein YkwD